jgi:tRNA(adenine34) deaminase
MELAIQHAHEGYRQGHHAVAAVVVKDDKVIATGVTSVAKDADPTAHAELNAIRSACKLVGSRYLDGCYLYSTYEPCPMCTSAAIWARMAGIVFGASREDETKEYSWRVVIPAADVIKAGMPKLELHSHFLREECKQLLNLNGTGN